MRFPQVTESSASGTAQPEELFLVPSSQPVCVCDVDKPQSWHDCNDPRAPSAFYLIWEFHPPSVLELYVSLACVLVSLPSQTFLGLDISGALHWGHCSSINSPIILKAQSVLALPRASSWAGCVGHRHGVHHGIRLFSKEPLLPLSSREGRSDGELLCVATAVSTSRAQ